MRERALQAGVPASWGTGERIDGGDRRWRVWRVWRVWLEQPEPPVVLAVARHEPRFAVVDGPWGDPRADVSAAHMPAESTCPPTRGSASQQARERRDHGERTGRASGGRGGT